MMTTNTEEAVVLEERLLIRARVESTASAGIRSGGFFRDGKPLPW